MGHQQAAGRRVRTKRMHGAHPIDGKQGIDVSSGIPIQRTPLGVRVN